MKLRWGRFNTILLGFVILASSACQSDGGKKGKDNKERALLRLHLETNADGTERSRQISVVRASPVQLNVENSPFIDEGSISEAALMETKTGFDIQILMDSHGKLLLENYTTAFKGKRMAVFCQFTDSRWLAAPRITGVNRTGIFTFTPDCSREEADYIVKGLNNLARAVRNESFFKDKP